MQSFDFIHNINSLIAADSERRKVTGEDFNIFSIMSMEYDEVFTHSAIIAELLNPNGKHGLGKIPLEIFVKNIIGEEFPLDFKSSKSYKEEFIGKINDDKTEGGRLDIIVKDNEGTTFLIENKIYAGEQPNQLHRYNQFNKDAKILYLTLDGTESKNINFETKYQKISYETDILNWIDECVKNAYDKPIIRETLIQYSNLIKKLTNQTQSHKLAMDIREIIKKNLTASAEVYNNYEAVIVDMQNDLLDKIKDKIPSELNPHIGIYTNQKSLIINLLNLEIILRFKTLKIPRIVIKNADDKAALELSNYITNFKPWNNLHYLDLEKINDEDLLVENQDRLSEFFKEKILDIVLKLKQSYNPKP